MTGRRFSVPAGFVLAILLALIPIAAWSQTPSYTLSTLTSTPANASLIQASDGNYYGTSGSMVFKMDSGGVVTPIYTFCSTGSCPNGSEPESSLIQGSDGNFYGTTQTGGAYGMGVIYRLGASGTLRVVHSFCSSLTPGGACVDGIFPESLIQGSDGNLYGTTEGGGIGGNGFNQDCPDGNSGLMGGCGTIFKLTAAGTFTTIHNFCVEGGCTDGADPFEAALVQGSDGNFYGTAAQGGLDSSGAVFTISSSGTYNVVYNFCPDDIPCTDGTYPDSSLVEGLDGNFYGTTNQGGNNGVGTVFKVTPAGALSTLHSFCMVQGCPDGAEPFLGLFLAGDGNFYGAADLDTTLFQVSPSGAFTLVDGSPGEGYAEGILQGSDGNFYDGFQHAILKVSVSPALAPPVVLSFSESQVSVGSPSTLTWQVLNGNSLTLQQCYAYVQGGSSGAGTWTGKQMGTYSDGVYSGFTTITPTAAGTYTYALTCGGTESGFATLSAGTGKPLPTVTLSASPNPVMVGQKVTLTATVAGGSGTPTGNVWFYYGSDLLGTGTLNSSGVATYTASAIGIPVGTYAITARYPGNGTYAAVTSQAIPVNVSKSQTTVALTASPNPVTPPDRCTLTATVKRASSGEGVPTGTVTFYYKGQVIGSAGLNGSGVASVTASTSTLPEASYSITATYSGDSSDLTSTSAVLAVTVE